jgi:transporter family-2 protein
MAAAMQAAVNAGLAKAAGLGPALVINSLVVLTGATALWAGMGTKATFFPSGTPWIMYIGGILGFMIIASLAVAFPKIGAAYAIILMIAGQCSAALVIDHFGLVGMPRDPVTTRRLIGVLMVAIGAVVMKA